jgi:tyrosyl-tRNA synthetase
MTQVLPASIQRGMSEVFPNQPDSKDSTENLALKLQQSDRRLRIKFGIDPTGTDVQLGHTAVLIFGDFTARIGDPTGKSEVRKQLTESDVAANVKTYIEQIRPILDFETPERLEIRYNSEWLAGLDLSKIINLLHTMTVGQMLAKEGFSERYERGNPIFLHEFLYPLLQGYDSVAVQSDVEIGGTDQKFNIAVGRDLQRHFGQSPQFGVLTPILTGTDGVQKMSKSLNNYVALAEDPVSMYSKLEKVPDDLINQYFELLTNLPLDQLPEDPRDRQKLLALDLVGQFHGKEIAEKTQQSVLSMIAGGQTETELVPEFSLAQQQFPTKLFYLIASSGLCPSSSDARRQIQGGAVKLEGQKIEQSDWVVESPTELVGKILQIGKKKFLRFTL